MRSISIMQRVETPNKRHNKDLQYRSKLENVDPELSKYNEIIVEKSIEEIYAERLQPAFEEFNAKQKRRDRRLDVKWGANSALEYQRALDAAARASKNNIDQQGRPPIREIVWQFGNPDQGFGCADQTPESRELARELLLETFEEAKNRYPNFAWGDVIFHADEVTKSADDHQHGSFHLHTSFVPLCFENKQGMSVQVAFERSLREMGFDTFESWKHDLDEIMEDVLERHGFERAFMNNHNAHQDSKEFHRQQKVIRETRELENRYAITQIAVAEAQRAVTTELQSAVEEIATCDDDAYAQAFLYIDNCPDEEFERIVEEGQKIAVSHATALAEQIAAADVGEEIEHKMTWEERQKAWANYRVASEQFWEMRNEYANDLQFAILQEYKDRQRVNREYWWAKRFLREYPLFIGNIFVIGYLCYKGIERANHNAKIRELKDEKQQLRKMVSEFSRDSREWRDALKGGKLPTERVMDVMAGIVKKLDERSKIMINDDDRNTRTARDWHSMSYFEQYARIMSDQYLRIGDLSGAKIWRRKADDFHEHHVPNLEQEIYYKELIDQMTPEELGRYARFVERLRKQNSR